MLPRPLIFLASLVVAFASSGASALSVLDDQRRIAISGSYDIPDFPYVAYIDESAEATAPLFDETVTTNGVVAQQTSEIGPTTELAGVRSLSMSGTGFATSYFDAVATSTFEVDFELDSPTWVSFEGVLTADYGDYGSIWATASLTPEHSFRAEDSTTPFQVETLLGPGVYTVLLRATSGAFGDGSAPDASFDFNLTLTVPEPGTSLLFFVGLAAALASRPRRRRPVR